ncbi:MAG: hypothetical protein ABI047_18005 [Jatrophihabitantaceae bacterium]
MSSAVLEEKAFESDGALAGRQVQFSIDCAAVREHAQRLVAAGATLVAERDEASSWWIVLLTRKATNFVYSEAHQIPIALTRLADRRRSPRGSGRGG